MKSFAARLRSARRAMGCTQAELAESLAVSRSAVAQWERENGSDPAVANLSQLALVLGCSFEWLATGRGRRDFTDPRQAEELSLEPVLRHFARDDGEERMLELFRDLETWDQQLTLDLLLNLVTRAVRKRGRMRQVHASRSNRVMVISPAA